MDASQGDLNLFNSAILIYASTTISARLISVSAEVRAKKREQQHRCDVTA